MFHIFLLPQFPLNLWKGWACVSGENVPHSVYSCHAIYSLIDLFTGGKPYCAQLLVMLCCWDAGSKHELKLLMLLLRSVLVLQRKSGFVFFKFWAVMSHFLTFSMLMLSLFTKLLGYFKSIKPSWFTYRF